MHEYSIAQALLEQVERHTAPHPGARVQKLQLRVGTLAGVEPELLRTAWELCRERTICERAELSIDTVVASWTCPRCGAAIASGEKLQCGACQVPARLSAGDEIVLARIEMEVA
jgi:hydrogenase nickel incorporation protein HypA/HybF